MSLLSNRGMKQKSWVIALLTLFSASGLMAGVREEFAKLEEEMERAIEALEAAKIRGNNKDSAPSEAAPPAMADARPEILKKMDALAGSAQSPDELAFVLFETMRYAFALAPESMLPRFEKAARDYPDDERLAELVAYAPELASETGQGKQWLPALERLSSTTKNKDTKLGAAIGIGDILLSAKEPKEARQAFERVLKMEPDPEVVDLVKGYIYEIEHLQIGMVAPDFEVKALDGRQVATKAMRGKVYLLNFWASW